MLFDLYQLSQGHHSVMRDLLREVMERLQFSKYTLGVMHGIICMSFIILTKSDHWGTESRGLQMETINSQHSKN